MLRHCQMITFHLARVGATAGFELFPLGSLLVPMAGLLELGFPEFWALSLEPEGEGDDDAEEDTDDVADPDDMDPVRG